MRNTLYVWHKKDKVEDNNNSSDNYPYKRLCNAESSNLKEKILNIYNRPKDTPICTCSSAMGGITALVATNAKSCFSMHENTYYETFSVLNRLTSSASISSFPINGYYFCEPLSNPLLLRTDIRDISEKAHSVGCKVVVDNSMLSCYNYNPFDDGADIVVESFSKYADGHGDVIGGVLIGEDVSNMAYNMGIFMQPREAYLVARSLNTLPLRMEKQRDNAKRVYEYLLTLTPNVLFDDRISVITFSFANNKRRDDFLFHSKIAVLCKLCSIEGTFGQVNTIILPQDFTQKYVYVPPEYEAYKRTCIRLSVGLEDPDDIIADIKQAYEKAIKENQ